MKYCLTIFLFCLSLTGFAQVNINNTLIQVSGIITDADSNTVVPYVTINNKKNKQSISADYRGYFSLIARPGDTIAFSAVGYKNTYQVVPSNLNQDSYTIMVKLKSDIVVLQAVRIYPWATVEDFTRTFLAMKIADDDMELAKKNLSGKSIRELSLTLPRDGGEINSMNNRLEHERSLNRNMVQTNPLLNPFAWGRLLQSIIKGDKSREADN